MTVPSWLVDAPNAPWVWLTASIIGLTVSWALWHRIQRLRAGTWTDLPRHHHSPPRPRPLRTTARPRLYDWARHCPELSTQPEDQRPNDQRQGARP